MVRQARSIDLFSPSRRIYHKDYHLSTMEGFENFTRSFHFDTYPAISPSHPENNLSGKSVLITGGGYGIGPSIASSFAEAGASRIAITGRTKSKLDATAAELAKKHSSTSFSVFVADVVDAIATAAIFSDFGTPDVLVNNAGYMSDPGTLVQMDDLSEWWHAFETNVLGTAVVTQAYLKQCQRDHPSTPGTVFTISTLAAHWGNQMVGFSSYSASKAGQLRMMEMFAEEAGKDLRFVTVHPGAVDTAMTDKTGLKGKLPMSEPQLVADWLVWATKNADWLHGKFVWAGWDVNDLKAKKEEIRDSDLLTYGIVGLPVQG